MPPGEDQRSARELLASIGWVVNGSRDPSDFDEPVWLEDLNDPPAQDAEWRSQVQRTLLSMGTWAQARIEEEPDRREGRRVRRVSKRNRYAIDDHEEREPAEPDPSTRRFAAEETGFLRYVTPRQLGVPNSVVLARGQVRRGPLFTLALVAALLLPFGLGWVRWRSRGQSRARGE